MPDDLFPETTFGGRCAELLKAEKVRAGNLSWEIVSSIIEGELERSFPKSKRITREVRGELFNALVKACGEEPDKMTKPAARLAAVSLAQIKEACPDVDASELTRRVERHKRLYPGAAFTTPRSVAMHWARLNGHANTSTTGSSYVEPADWRSKLKETALAAGYDTDRIQEICAGSWRDVPLSAQEMILKSQK